MDIPSHAEKRDVPTRTMIKAFPMIVLIILDRLLTQHEASLPKAFTFDCKYNQFTTIRASLEMKDMQLTTKRVIME